MARRRSPHRRSRWRGKPRASKPTPPDFFQREDSNLPGIGVGTPEERDHVENSRDCERHAALMRGAS